jgi:aminoglycoside 3-N-acetyltransferase
MELPNIPGQSHRFNDIEPALAGQTREVVIGCCRARRIAISEVLAIAERLIERDPAALLCPNPECRCGAALHQRLACLVPHRRESTRPGTVLDLAALEDHAIIAGG